MRKGRIRPGLARNAICRKTWRDYDEQERERVVLGLTTKRHWPCRTKRLTSTTASRAESLSRSLRNVVHHYSSRILLPLAAFLPFFHAIFFPQIFERFRIFSNRNTYIYMSNIFSPKKLKCLSLSFTNLRK